MINIFELGSNNIFNGKASYLNKFYNEFNICKGFVITNEVLCDFLRDNNISLEEDFRIIKDKIMKGVFTFEEELLMYFKNNNYKNVIVRSSAYLEDGNNHSFAGQFDSFTNTNVDNLIDNIKKCWASYFNENVKEYMRNIKNNNYNFDVLIQEMIISDYSGVCFSTNPADGNDEYLIEVSDRQCEMLVSGKIIPHTYHINNNYSHCDNFISKEMILEITNCIDKIKSILKKEIEIEFCFKNNTFYLFQIRPITHIYYSLENHINNVFWCCFKNNNWTLFNRSLWILGATKYKNKVISNKIVEDITIYYPHNKKQLRGFRGDQPPLDKSTLNKLNYKDLNNYIDYSYFISEKIHNLEYIINRNICDNNYKDFIINLEKIIKKNAILNSYEYLISSLCNALFDDLDSNTIKKFNIWKNDQNKSYFLIYDKIFSYIYNYFDFKIDFKLFRTYIHVDEVIKLCKGKLKKETITSRIIYRECNGFILLNLNNMKYINKVIHNKKIFNVVDKRFYQLLNNYINKNNMGIKGLSTLKNGKLITGECVVIKDNDTNISDVNLDGKILVCNVTTSKDIKYLKCIKALVVNNGGVLCHSAIFSREYNIPCLMGCNTATEYFNTGDIITYNVDLELVYKNS